MATSADELREELDRMALREDLSLAPGALLNLLQAKDGVMKVALASILRVADTRVEMLLAVDPHANPSEIIRHQTFVLGLRLAVDILLQRAYAQDEDKDDGNQD